MEGKIAFERFLFGDGNESFVDDIEFCVDRIVMLPKVRPHQLEKAVKLSVEYSKLDDFRRKILEKSNECPVLIYQLYKKGVLEFGDIEPYLRKDDAFLLSYYFRKEIDDFDKYILNKSYPNTFDLSFFKNENEIDQFIEYGYHRSSIEYCLKYDLVDGLVLGDNLSQEAKWSPFEWSYKPEFLDLLSFTGFFGSIKCFKHLLMKGFEINNQVISMVVCSGCLDLYNLCSGQQFETSKLLCKVSEFSHHSFLDIMIKNGADLNAKFLFNKTPLHWAASNGHLSIVEYLVNQKVDINAKNNDVELMFLNILPFIQLLQMATLVLSSILLNKGQI